MFPSPWDTGVTSFCQDDKMHPEITCQCSLRSMLREDACCEGDLRPQRERKEGGGGKMEERNGGKEEKKKGEKEGREGGRQKGKKEGREGKKRMKL